MALRDFGRVGEVQLRFRTWPVVGCGSVSSDEGLTASTYCAEWTEQLRVAASRGDALDLANSGDVPGRAIREAITGSAAHHVPLRRLILRNARIVGLIDIDGMTVDCPLIFAGCVFTGTVSLRESDVASLQMTDCVLSEGLDASGASVRRSLELNAGCQACQVVSLNGARIGTWLDCSGGTFRDDGDVALYAEAMTVGGDVVLAQGFCSEGEVRLGATEIGGQLNCAGGYFRNVGGVAVSADSLRVKGGVFFGKLDDSSARHPWEYSSRRFQETPETEHAGSRTAGKFLAEGQVSMPRAVIDGELYLDGGEIRNPGAAALFADSVKVGGRTVLGPELKINGQVRLQRAEVGSQLRVECSITPADDPSLDGDLALDLEAAYISRAVILRPRAPVTGIINLVNGRFGHLRDFQVAWTGEYRLFGLTFGSLGRTSTLGDGGEAFPTTHFSPQTEEERATDVYNRLKWLEGDRDGYQPQLYDQLAEHYRRSGDEASQIEVLMAKQRGRREWLPRTARWWNTMIDKLLGYGYESWRVLIPLGGLLMAGFVFFWVEHSGEHNIIPKDPTQHAPTFHALLYTLDTLVPILGLGQRESFTARSIAELGAACFLLCGWLLSSMLIAGLSGLVRRFNR